MVIGNGLVANAFRTYKNNEDYLVFASGVSNSASEDPQQFEREKILLQDVLKEHHLKTLIYFSTCSIYDESLKNSPYVKHKLAMEELIMKRQSNYHIFRISNLAGNTSNPHTVLNYFFQHIFRYDFFYLWKNACRNVIDVDDAFSVTDFIVKNNLFKNETINIANPVNYSVIKIVELLEEIIGKKGNYSIIDKGGTPEIDVKPIQHLFPILNMSFDESYLKKTLKKYYR